MIISSFNKLITYYVETKVKHPISAAINTVSATDVNGSPITAMI